MKTAPTIHFMDEIPVLPRPGSRVSCLQLWHFAPLPGRGLVVKKLSRSSWLISSSFSPVCWVFPRFLQLIAIVPQNLLRCNGVRRCSLEVWSRPPHCCTQVEDAPENRQTVAIVAGQGQLSCGMTTTGGKSCRILPFFPSKLRRNP